MKPLAESINALPGETQRHVQPLAQATSLQATIARQAQAAWAAAGLRQRLAVIRHFRHLLTEGAQRLATTAVGYQTRALAEILAAEILPLAEAARFLEREAGQILAPRRLGFRHRPLWLGRVTSEIYREPFGLILVISPSNYPILLPGVQVIQALAAGNAVWLKPGPGGGAAALELARCLQVAGLPEHVLTILPESAEAARSAIAAGVDKVLFTGSARVGKELLAQLAERAIPATLELSGCDPVIIRADADLDLAVRALAFGLRLNSGQTCIAPRRVLVARTVATEFEGRLAQVLNHCVIPTSPTQQGRLLLASLSALAHGAHLLAGRVTAGTPVIGPVVLAGVAPESPVLKEDIFGPLLFVVTVSDDDEAVKHANASAFALGASIFSRDETSARRLAARIEAGVVVINDLIAPTADARLPFGGRKLSGFGVTRGAEGLLEMTTQKVVALHRGRFRPHYDPPASGQAEFFLSFLRASHGPGWKNRLAGLLDFVRAARRLRRASNSPNQHQSL